MLTLLLACQGPDADTDLGEPLWSAPDQRGPYASGVTTLAFTDARGKGLTVEVWYPAEPVAGDLPDPYPEVPITRNAYRDAPVVPGPWPLVAFSHGNAGIRWQSVFLTEHLAEHGFVVVAPDHTHNTFLDYDDARTVDVMLERPGDVVAAVDEVLARAAGGDPLLAGAVDDERYAMIGHSFGGWTAMVVAGGVLDPAGFEAHCATSDDALCSLVGDVPDDAVPPVSDPRAVLAVPMTPCGWYTMGAAGPAGLAPSLYLGGGLDPICSMTTEVHPAWERSPSPKAEAVLPLAGHFAFSDLCLFAPMLSDECGEEDSGYGVIADEQAAVQALVTAFVGARFVGDARYEPWLDDQRPSVFAWTAQ
jgi:predicted dienelactone hydrolase